jgi:hypothetical protein
MNLEKAKLTAIYGDVDNIEFMFNPNELAFSRNMELEQSRGARTHTGQNKVSFKHPNPYSLKISNVMLDTYETGKTVLDKVKPFTKAVEFTQKGEGDKKRPPIYLFTWGQNNYLRCFVKSFNFKLTLFLPDGTPVRAVIDLTLEQVDPPTPERNQGTPNPGQGERQQSGNLFLT